MAYSPSREMSTALVFEDQVLAHDSFSLVGRWLVGRAVPEPSTALLLAAGLAAFAERRR